MFNSLFQFQYGAIKRRPDLKPAVTLRNFNSNMVRLKEKHHRRPKRALHKFQFQYGAIKSIFNLLGLKRNHEFQFQYGAIKS